MYYNARFHDPSIGRFLTADTMVPNPMDAQQFNRYAYVTNNPIKYTDPTGHRLDDPNSNDKDRGFEPDRGDRKSKHERDRDKNSKKKSYKKTIKVKVKSNGSVLTKETTTRATTDENGNTKRHTYEINRLNSNAYEFDPDLPDNLGLETDWGTTIVGVIFTTVVVKVLCVFSATGMKFGVHGPHHKFGRFGHRSHIQLNTWTKGVKGSGKTRFRIPFGPRRN